MNQIVHCISLEQIVHCISLGQVAGFTVGFPGMRFATVHGAGHMVPSTRPQQALDLFRRFLSKSWK